MKRAQLVELASVSIITTRKSPPMPGRFGRRNGKSYVVLRDTDSGEDDVSIPQAQTVTLSANHRRIQQTPRSPQKSCRFAEPAPCYNWNPSPQYDLPDLDGSFQRAHNTEFTSAQPSDVAAKVASKRYPTSVSVIVIIFNAIPSIKQDAPLQEWSGRTKEDPGFWEEFLSELLRLEGRGDARQGTCMTCKGPCGVFRCDDCFGGRLECSDCCLARHKTLPLHIQRV